MAARVRRECGPPERPGRPPARLKVLVLTFKALRSFDRPGHLKERLFPRQASCAPRPSWEALLWVTLPSEVRWIGAGVGASSCPGRLPGSLRLLGAVCVSPAFFVFLTVLSDWNWWLSPCRRPVCSPVAFQPCRVFPLTL